MSEEETDQGDYKPMASTFHTPSFGDEDFNLLPSLTLTPSEGSTTDDNVFSMTSSVTSSSPSETMAPPLTSTPPCVTEYEPNPASSEPHPASSIPQAVTSHMVMAQNPVVTTTQMANMPMHHMNAYHQQHPHHPQQTFQPHPNFYGQQMMDNHYHGNSHFLPKFPPPTFDIPDIQASLAGADNNNHNINNNNMHLVTTTVMATSQAMLLEMPPGHHGNNMPQPQAPPTHRGQRIITQMSPPGSNTTSPGRESSAEESSSDDSIPLAQLAQKRNAPAPPKPPAPAPAKKPRTPKKRKKKDPNEPQKPVSAYALFFRDTQAAIKTRNPNASFGEVSKIVASMWDGLEEDHKNDYKKRTETAKKEYLKQLAAYRATLVSKGALENGQDGGNAPVNQRNNTSPKNVAHNNNTSSPSLPPNPAAMTPAHHATSHPSMHHPPPPHLSQIAQMNGNGHMMQHYGMAPMMSPGHGTMGPPPPPHMMAPPGGGMSPATRSPPEGIRMHDGYMAPQVHPSSPPMAMDSPGTAPSMCVRTGCGNPAIHSPGWDNEYCSNDCVVSHCRDAFTRWVATRQGNHSNTSYASVK